MKILEQLKQEADRILQNWQQIQKKVAKNQPEDKQTLKAKTAKKNTLKKKLHYPVKTEDTQSLNEETLVEVRKQTSFKVISKDDSRNPLNYITCFSINGVLISQRNELFKMKTLMIIKKQDSTIILPLP